GPECPGGGLVLFLWEVDAGRVGVVDNLDRARDALADEERRQGRRIGPWRQDRRRIARRDRQGRAGAAGLPRREGPGRLSRKGGADGSVLSASQLCVSYGETRALWEVNFELKRSEVVALIGPNG